MAKIDVVLTSVLDDGKEQLQPGEIVNMEASQAEKLVGLGMVQVLRIEAQGKKAKPAKGKAARGANSKEGPALFADDPNQDLDGAGETGDETNVDDENSSVEEIGDV